MPGAFGRAVGILMIGTGAGQIVIVAVSPILTRLYEPEDFGAFAVIVAILSVLVTVTCLRYDYAITLPSDDLTAANVLALSLLINACLSLIAAIAFWLSGPMLLGALGAGALSPYAWAILLVGQFSGGAASAFTNWGVRVRAFKAIASTRLAQGLTLATVQIALGLLVLGPAGLAVGDAAGRTVGSGGIASAAWRSHGGLFRRVSVPGIRSAASRYRRFPAFSTPSALLATIASQAPVIAMVAFYGPESGGIFALSVRVSALPLTLVADAVGRVYVSEAARVDSLPMQWDLFRRTTRNLTTVAIGPAVILAIAAPLLAGLVFGEEWATAGLFVAILIPSYLMQFVAAATGDIVYVLERQDLQLLREVVRLACLGAAIPVAAMLGWSATGAVAMLGVFGVVNYALYGLISVRAIRSIAGSRR